MRKYPETFVWRDWPLPLVGPFAHRTAYTRIAWSFWDMAWFRFPIFAALFWRLCSLSLGWFLGAYIKLMRFMKLYMPPLIQRAEPTQRAAWSPLSETGPLRAAAASASQSGIWEPGACSEPQHYCLSTTNRPSTNRRERTRVRYVLFQIERFSGVWCDLNYGFTNKDGNVQVSLERTVRTVQIVQAATVQADELG